MTDHAIYIAVRRDLNMPRGKEIAQACHAVLMMNKHYGDVSGLPIIAVRAKDEAALDRMCAEADELGVRAFVVRDAGLTVVEPGTKTCAAIGPVDKSKVPLLVNAELF